MEFDVHEWVLILRLTLLTGPKLQTWWQGPFLVMQRNGSQGYTVEVSKGDLKKFMLIKRKKCVQTDTPRLLNPLAFQGASPGSFPKIEKNWGQRKLDEAGNACPLQLFVQ